MAIFSFGQSQKFESDGDEMRCFLVKDLSQRNQESEKNGEKILNSDRKGLFSFISEAVNRDGCYCFYFLFSEESWIAISRSDKDGGSIERNYVQNKLNTQLSLPNDRKIEVYFFSVEDLKRLMGNNNFKSGTVQYNLCVLKVPNHFVPFKKDRAIAELVIEKKGRIIKRSGKSYSETKDKVVINYFERQRELAIGNEWFYNVFFPDLDFRLKLYYQTETPDNFFVDEFAGYIQEGSGTLKSNVPYQYKVEKIEDGFKMRFYLPQSSDKSNKSEQEVVRITLRFLTGKEEKKETQEKRKKDVEKEESYFLSEDVCIEEKKGNREKKLIMSAEDVSIKAGHVRQLKEILEGERVIFFPPESRGGEKMDTYTFLLNGEGDFTAHNDRAILECTVSYSGLNIKVLKDNVKLGVLANRNMDEVFSVNDIFSIGIDEIRSGKKIYKFSFEERGTVKEFIIGNYVPYLVDKNKTIFCFIYKKPQKRTFYQGQIVSIGRNPLCDIQLPSSKTSKGGSAPMKFLNLETSRFHALIDFSSDRIYSLSTKFPCYILRNKYVEVIGPSRGFDSSIFLKTHSKMELNRIFMDLIRKGFLIGIDLRKGDLLIIGNTSFYYGLDMANYINLYSWQGKKLMEKNEIEMVPRRERKKVKKKERVEVKENLQSETEEKTLPQKGKISAINEEEEKGFLDDEEEEKTGILSTEELEFVPVGEEVEYESNSTPEIFVEKSEVFFYFDENNFPNIEDATHSMKFHGWWVEEGLESALIGNMKTAKLVIMEKKKNKDNIIPFIFNYSIYEKFVGEGNKKSGNFEFSINKENQINPEINLPHGKGTFLKFEDLSSDERYNFNIYLTMGKDVKISLPCMGRDVKYSFSLEAISSGIYKLKIEIPELESVSDNILCAVNSHGKYIWKKFSVFKKMRKDAFEEGSFFIFCNMVYEFCSEV